MNEFASSFEPEQSMQPEGQEGLETPEIKAEQESIPKIEMLADVRLLIEEEVLGKNPPVEEWPKVANQILAQHPELSDNAGLVQSMISVAQESHHRMIGWLNQEFPELTQEIFNSPEFGRQVFARLFDVEATEDVRVYHSAVALILETGSQSIASVATLGIVAFAARRHGIETIVLPRPGSLALEQTQHLISASHESAHVIMRILSDGRVNFLQSNIVEDNILKTQSGDKEKKYKLSQVTPLEFYLVDEILAQASGIGYSMKYLDVEKTDPQAMSDLLDAQKGQIETLYLDRLSKQLTIATAQEREELGVKIEAGYKSLKELTDLYDGNLLKAAAVLEQIPLARWPAITRLLKIKRINNDNNNTVL